MTAQPAALTRPRAPLPSADDPRWHAEVAPPAAHALAHPRPIHGCPWCPAGAEPVDPSSETHWREVANRRPDWGGTR